MNLLLVVVSSLIFLVYSLPPSQFKKYDGYQVFQVIFEPHDNTTALTEYAKGKQKGVHVWKIDYLRGASEVAVSPQRYTDVRLEFESDQLDNFNIVCVNLSENIQENLGNAAP